MRNLNKLYGGSGAKTTSLNPSGTPPGCGDRLELPPSLPQVQESLSSMINLSIGSGHPPTLKDLTLSLSQQKDGAVESKDGSRTLWRRVSYILWIQRAPTLSWQSETLIKLYGQQSFPAGPNTIAHVKTTGQLSLRAQSL